MNKKTVIIAGAAALFASSVAMAGVNSSVSNPDAIAKTAQTQLHACGGCSGCCAACSGCCGASSGCCAASGCCAGSCSGCCAGSDN